MTVKLLAALENRPKLGNYPHDASKAELRRYATRIVDWLEKFEQMVIDDQKQLENITRFFADHWEISYHGSEIVQILKDRLLEAT